MSPPTHQLRRLVDDDSCEPPLIPIRSDSNLFKGGSKNDEKQASGSSSTNYFENHANNGDHMSYFSLACEKDDTDTISTITMDRKITTLEYCSANKIEVEIDHGTPPWRRMASASVSSSSRGERDWKSHQETKPDSEIYTSTDREQKSCQETKPDSEIHTDKDWKSCQEINRGCDSSGANVAPSLSTNSSSSYKYIIPRVQNSGTSIVSASSFISESIIESKVKEKSLKDEKDLENQISTSKDPSLEAATASSSSFNGVIHCDGTTESFISTHRENNRKKFCLPCFCIFLVFLLAVSGYLGWNFFFRHVDEPLQIINGTLQSIIPLSASTSRPLPTMSEATKQVTQTPTQATLKAPTYFPTKAPITQAPTYFPTKAPITQAPTYFPTKASRTQAPTNFSTKAPITHAPTTEDTIAQATTTQLPTTISPSTKSPTTQAPLQAPSQMPTKAPSQVPIQISSQTPSQIPLQIATTQPIQLPALDFLTNNTDTKIRLPKITMPELLQDIANIFTGRGS